MSVTASIIIVNYKVGNLVVECVDSIFSDPSCPEVEVFIVDNSCDSEEKEILSEITEKHPLVQLEFNQENVGFAVANNQGLSKAKGEYVVLLNPDTIVTPGWFQSIQSHLENHEDIGLINPLTNRVGHYGALNFGLDEQVESILEKGSEVCGLYKGQWIEMPGLGFFCVAGKRKVFSEIGELNEEFRIGGFEDDDYCRRAKEKGYKLALGLDSFVYHHHFKSFSQIKFSERSKISEENKEIYEKKWGTYHDQLELKHFFNLMGQSLRTLEKAIEPSQFPLLSFPKSVLETGTNEFLRRWENNSHLEEKHDPTIEGEIQTHRGDLSDSLAAKLGEKEKALEELRKYIDDLEVQLEARDKTIEERRKYIGTLETSLTAKESHIDGLEHKVAEKEKIIRRNILEEGGVSFESLEIELGERERIIKEREKYISSLEGKLADLAQMAKGEISGNSKELMESAQKFSDSLSTVVQRQKRSLESSERLYKDLKKEVQSAFNQIREMPSALQEVLSSKTYKLIMFFRAFRGELRSGEPKRVVEFFRRAWEYSKGRRGVLSRYIMEDPFFMTFEKLDALCVKCFETRLVGLDGVLDMSGPQVAEQEKNEISSPGKLPEKLKRKGGVAFLTNQLLDVADRRPRYGGGERYCLELAGLLTDLGLKVNFYQLGHEPFEGNYHGHQVRALSIGNKAYSEFNLSATREFYDISMEYDFVIYHCPELSAGDMRPDAINICHGIWFDHNNYGLRSHYRTAEWYKYLYRAFSNPKITVSVDTNSINTIRSLWPELAVKMRYIPNFFDPKNFYPPSRPRKNAPLKILFPRRSQVNRGSRILGEILKRVPHDVKFFWVGEGDEKDTQIIRKLCQKDPRLQFSAGTFEEMPEWYKQSDITVIPTLACEGTSLSCIEALASGCAVVSTNVGGLPDLIQDDVNGLLVDARPEPIAEAINRLIENEEQRTRLQNVGAESSATFTLSKWRQRWTKVLQSLEWIES